MRNEFIQRCATAWDVSFDRAEQLLSTKYKVAVRLNDLKSSKTALASLRKAYGAIQELKWAKNAFYVDESIIRPSELPEFSSGEIIVQNPASFIPVLELKPSADDNILDMCSAPGAKSSHIASLSLNKAQLTLNDTSKSRFFKMRKLMEIMGVKAQYTLKDGRFLYKIYGPNFFDKILLDAPCSGEANMNLDDLDKWSLRTIKRLSGLQSKLLQGAFEMLKPGGRLVYSTCTIAPEENEMVIDGLLRQNTSAKILPVASYPIDSIPGLTQWNGKHLSMTLANTLRILPSPEAKPFFVAVITKTNAEEDDSYERLKRAFL